MTTTEYIALCQLRLAQIEGIFRQMEKDGISKDVSVWGVLEEKHLFWTSRLEAVSAVDPANNYLFTGDDYFLN